MKKIYLLFGVVLLYSLSQAQTGLAISPGTDVFISGGTPFYSGGITLNPSSGFTLNGVVLTKATTVSHSTANNYVGSVYKFSANTNSFTGTIQFSYLDADLNGLTESTLQVNIHNGTSWQAITSTTNDAVNNYVLTTSVTGKVLNELALAGALATLPLQWGAISAYRQSQSVKIEWTTQQEYNVSHFAVDRSSDGRNWITIADNIMARNMAEPQHYSFTDNDHNSSRLLYRIRQTGIDGRSTYSSIAAVAAENESSHLLVYPNPVNQSFYISNIATDAVKSIRLYNSAGVLARSWISVQASYDIQDIAAGIYQLRIELKDGSSQDFKINKQ